MPEAKLYVILGSHPSRTAMLMLERKGIPYKRVDLMPVISKGVLKVQRFPGITVSWWAFKRDRAPMASYWEVARLGVPIGLAVKTGGPLVATAARLNGSTDAQVIADLSSLRADLDPDRRLDRRRRGRRAGAERSGLQLAPSLRLLMSFDDLRPFIEGRPCGEMANRVVPEFPGRTPQIFPAEWLSALRS